MDDSRTTGTDVIELDPGADPAVSAHTLGARGGVHGGHGVGGAGRTRGGGGGLSQVSNVNVQRVH